MTEEKRPIPFETRLIASPEDYQPIGENFKIVGAFNPGVAAIKTKNGLESVLFVRVAEAPSEQIEGKVLAPFFHIQNYEGAPVDMRYDIFDKKSLKKVGIKEIVPKEGVVRLRHVSLPRILVLNNEREVTERSQEPAIRPSWEPDRFGMEDLRITPLNDSIYALTYSTPHRDFGVRTSILTIKNLKDPYGNLERITSKNTPRPEIDGKDAVLFPEMLPSPSETRTIEKGSKLYTAFMRPNAFYDLSTPGVWVSYSPDLVHWGQAHRLTISQQGEVTGTGAPPVKIGNKWVAAYHETRTKRNNKIDYSTKLIALDYKEPWKVLNISPTLLERSDFRKILPEDGFVEDVVFTTGMIVDGGRTDLYSGIGDKWTVLTSFYTEDIMKFLGKLS